MRVQDFLVVTAALAPSVSADWQFRSRPDLTPPRLNITVSADPALVEKGLIFVAPYPGFTPTSHGPIQPAPYIYRDDGELVWSGLGHIAGWAANFRPDTVDGSQVLRAFEGQMSAQLGIMHGHHLILNEKYETVKSVQSRSPQLISGHEFRVINGKSALVEVPFTKPFDLSRWGGKEGQDWIVSSGFQELDIETGQVLFEWEALDHVDPKYSAFPVDHLDRAIGSGRSSSDAWDYFHLNSVDKDDEGNYLISARNYAALFKVSGATGKVIWQLGGLHGGSSFEIAPAARFAYQHDARFLNRSSDGAIEYLSLFDNSAHSPTIKINPFSRGRILQLNHTDGTVKAAATYPAPDQLSAQTQGNTQVLPNSNVFVNWGQAGAVTEFAANGTVLFHAYLDSEPGGHSVQSYRGFKLPWTGRPIEEPAVVALGSEASDDVDIYVSWNGDTETTLWRFYAEELRADVARKRFLGDSNRHGFETHIKVKRPSSEEGYRIFAEAVDKNEHVLARSGSVAVTFGKRPLSEGQSSQTFPVAEEL
ncbi:hypothetical protein VD0002_g6950 [Verticillium dahliae]|uniref:Arylsulfotransferase n=1 Tax=Verticillium dahliae TaxID=27337 RepID=A0AA44WNL6_VERDA|nr:hypothetical protein BJF96_g1889 [Verticillium dahliae]PNH54358.1 hypothetical protein VD0003_g3133 [Verticillium dahliae]PNH60744.1 hypothetical protein VD0002_g6950 [Verticillium dahliae]